MKFRAAKLAFALSRRFQNLPKIEGVGFLSVSHRERLLGERETASGPSFKYCSQPSVPYAFLDRKIQLIHSKEYMIIQSEYVTWHDPNDPHAHALEGRVSTHALARLEAFDFKPDCVGCWSFEVEETTFNLLLPIVPFFLSSLKIHKGIDRLVKDLWYNPSLLVWFLFSDRHRCGDKKYKAITMLNSGEQLEKNDSVSLDKKQYRKEAIMRWKKKKNKYREAPTSRGSMASSSSGDGKTMQKYLSSNYMRRPVSNRRGKHLLQQIPFAADILPNVRHCRYCDVVKFHSETENFCCLNGRIVLSTNELPALMRDLLTSTSKEAESFRTFIKTYNNHFAFTSLGVKADTNLNKRNKGIYTFRVQGQIYHFINNLSRQGNDAKNLQLYFHDTDNEVENRFLDSPRLSRNLIAKCVGYLQENPYSHYSGQDQRVFNTPEVSQVAAIWVEGEENGEHGWRNIEIKLQSDCSRSVEYYYGCYDPLQYPLMFPFGELGWHQKIPKKKEAERGNGRNVVCTAEKLISPATATSVEHLLDMEENVLGRNFESAKYVSVREYYAYKLQMRRHDKSHLLHFGRLLQQYIVDNYVKLETQRLAFIRTQQGGIRQEFLQGIVDVMASGESEASAIARRVVLRANFTGGSRNMRRKFIDAMALVQKFGKPDLFLTLTCNPNWPEIKKNT
ncbi:hypothetical protein OSB04_016788 [Centaurea solstitialis]|uniref:Helitron helicase-like domain-containing protein n=1 Tax=Centaurea solstitialis TaxID=347529 RepID=A0AA38TLP4_9ASTR|nr:hypothetical protein OSB04_016788 [Centaurea solstitialis]